MILGIVAAVRLETFTGLGLSSAGRTERLLHAEQPIARWEGPRCALLGVRGS